MTTSQTKSRGLQGKQIEGTFWRGMAEQMERELVEGKVRSMPSPLYNSFSNARARAPLLHSFAASEGLRQGTLVDACTMLDWLNAQQQDSACLCACSGTQCIAVRC